jgi:hypothetical protein
MRLFHLPLSLSLCAFAVGCVTTYTPLTTTEGAALSNAQNELPVGHLGLTVTMANATYRGNSSVELHFKNKVNNEALKLVLNSGDFSGEPKSALFLLPASKYTLTKALLKSPGGNYGGQRYLPFEVKLALAEKIKDFELLPSEVLHLGEITTKVTMELQNNTAPRMHFSEGFESTKPNGELWRATLKSLNPKSTRYVNSNSVQSESLPWDLSKTVVAKTNASPTSLAWDVMRKKEVKGKLDSIGFDLRSCFRQHAPDFTGDAEMEVLIGASGVIEKHALTVPTLDKNQAMQTCLSKLAQVNKFTAREDGQSNSWNWTFPIKKSD